MTSQNRTQTTNGAQAFSSTLSSNLDFYNFSGNVTYPHLVPDFISCLSEDTEFALRNLLSTRDVRGGKGIRSNSRILLETLVTVNPDLILKTNLINKFVELGRWDDIFGLVSSGHPAISNLVIKFIATELKKEEPDNLLFKWLPINGKNSVDKILTSKLRSYLKLSPKEFRKFISSKRITFIPEFKFCTKQWDLLDYSTIPSQCFRKHKKAFERNDSERFNDFINRVIEGDPSVKVNAGAITPHEVVGPIRLSSGIFRRKMEESPITPAIEAQWKNLPDFLPEGLSILPVIDVSGSMSTKAYSNFSCMHISVALGLYFAERNKSVFKDLFLTFESNPQFVDISACTTLGQRYLETLEAPWGGSTNIEASFDLILNHAVRNSIPQADLPDYLLVVTDGQFDRMTTDRSFDTTLKILKGKFTAAGYTAPKLIFWNVSSTQDNVVATYDEKGVALLSGYSPALLKTLFEGQLESFTPLNAMINDLSQERYNIEFKE